MGFKKLLTALRLRDSRSYHPYNDFKEEVSEIIEYIREKKPECYKESLGKLETLKGCLLSKPELPAEIDDQIKQCCNDMLKEGGFEQFEMYGYGSEKVNVLSTENLESVGVIKSRRLDGVRIDEDRASAILNDMKKEGMTTVLHHTHNDLGWPSRRDYDMTLFFSDDLDICMTSRFGFGTVYLSPSKLKENYDLIDDLTMDMNSRTLWTALAKFYKPLKPPKEIMSFYKSVNSL
jgi:hypothetical protein